MTRHSTTSTRTYGLLATAALLLAAGCGHFLIPTAFRPASLEDQTAPGSNVSMDSRGLLGRRGDNRVILLPGQIGPPSRGEP